MNYKSMQLQTSTTQSDTIKSNYNTYNTILYNRIESHEISI